MKILGCDFYSGGKPTYCLADTNKLPDISYFFVTKGIYETYIHIENNESLSSDHTPVIMTISKLIITNKASAPKLTTGKTDWYVFNSLVEENINLHVPIKDAVQLEEQFDLLKLFNVLHATVLLFVIKKEMKKLIIQLN